MVMGMGLVLLLFFTVALFPVWPFSRQLGYAPSALTASLLVSLIGLIQTGAML